MSSLPQRDDHGTAFSRTSAATQVVGDVFAGGAAAETWIGTAQADVASGGGGNDTMTGLAGDDRVSGGPGNDAITPGAGLDVVVFAPGDGAATVAGFDFNPTGGQDKLDISAFGITAGTFNNTTVTRTDTGANVLVTIVGTVPLVTINLTGVASTGSMDATDFVLS